MRNVIAWAKANPISIVAVVMVPVALGLLVFVQLSGSGFKEEIKDEQKWIRELEGLKRSTVDIPSEKPEQSMREVSFTITEASIEKMDRIRARMDDDFNQIKQQAARHNRGDDRPHPHRPMIDGLFPSPDGPGREYDAQAAYKRALYAFTRPLSDGPSDYPRMNAGRPMSMMELEEKIFQFVQDHLPVEANQGGAVPAMADHEYSELRDKAYARMIDLLRDHASRLHVYANTPTPIPDREGEFDFGADTPFHIEPWALGGELPTMSQLWEAQIALWIQQDIVEAIVITNRVADPEASVLTAPVKRLLKIQVDESYVGRTGEGLVRTYEREKVLGSTVKAKKQHGGRGARGVGGMMGPGGMGGPGGMPFGPGMGRPHAMPPGGFSPYGMGGPGGMGGMGSMGGMGMGEDGMGDTEEKQEDFQLSPTGRRSTALYDVRHATVKVVIDSKRMPMFIQALSQVNFITVLLATVKDIDEYSHIGGGAENRAGASSEYGAGVYVYGSHDAVELELLIETIWLRSWTAGDELEEGEQPGEGFNPGLMPDDIREILGLTRRVPRPGMGRDQWPEDDE